MYRKSVIVISALLFVFAIGGVWQAATPVKIVLDGYELKTEVPAQIIDGRTMVPLRVIAETLGAQVEWDADNYTVNIEPPSTTTSEWRFVSLNGEPTTWPYWVKDGKLYMEYRNAIQLVREGNRAPLHSVTYFHHSSTLYVNDVRYPLSFNTQDGLQIVSIDYLRDLGIVNFHWDGQAENIQLIYR
ncbi:MAG: copper amine oxidase N-terminal domain-containing protein [Bacillota bacterium]|nr:copper amine oxidase N-terminal domain-containing protein [Bacillota bacterium]